MGSENKYWEECKYCSMTTSDGSATALAKEKSEIQLLHVKLQIK